MEGLFIYNILSVSYLTATDVFVSCLLKSQAVKLVFVFNGWRAYLYKISCQ